MELTLLQTFRAVAEYGSFSRAAEYIHLTQPAVSKRVRQLEDDLGVRLFDRIGRRVRLTEAGRTLLPRARCLLNDAGEIRRLLANLSGKVCGRLVMGTSHHVGLHRLPEPLKSFTQAHPEVELDIRFMDSEAACHAVDIGDLELAIVTLPSNPIHQLQVRPIWKDPLIFMVSCNHPLAKRRRVTLDTLLKYPAVLPGSNTYTRGILERAVRTKSKSLVLHTGMETNYLETLRMLVEANLGWSLLPAIQLSPQLVVLEVAGMHLSRRLGAVTHKERSLSNAARAMIAACIETR